MDSLMTQRGRRRPCSDKRGFTLIELLVVIAIIGILAALLIAVINRAIIGAKTIGCVNNMRQINVGFQLHLTASGGLLPQEGYDPDGNVWWNNWPQVRGKDLLDGSNDSDEVWYNAIPKAMGILRAKDYYTNLNAFYSSGNIMQCPAANFPAKAYLPNYPIALFSIAMNSHLINYPYGPTINFIAIQRHDTSKVVLFMDNLLEGEIPVYSSQETICLGQSAGWPNRYAGNRHGSSGNLLFADGHVETRPGPYVVDEATGGPNPNTPIIWIIYP
jgi:prepilin-type N-terminal cleavage/methylation domain-containing protein/prepilin-type processing-associated H-X9-DG protein